MSRRTAQDVHLGAGIRDQGVDAALIGDVADRIHP